MKDMDVVNLIFLPGFSTKEGVSLISGRGVGMDAVKKEVDRLGGGISVRSNLKRSTQIKVTLPLIL